MKSARRFLSLSFAMGLLVSLCASSSWAQAVTATPAGSLYSLGYYRIGSGPVGLLTQDNTLRLINDGASISDRSPNGTLCANIYVFGPNQNMQACCSCLVSANGLLTRSVLNDLIPTFAVRPGVSGVIKVVSSLPSTDGVCAADSAYIPSPEFAGWISHYPGTPIPSVLTEEQLKDGVLSVGELKNLESECGTGLSNSPATVHECSCPAAGG